jgi:hypothetical protein
MPMDCDSWACAGTLMFREETLPKRVSINTYSGSSHACMQLSQSINQSINLSLPAALANKMPHRRVTSLLIWNNTSCLRWSFRVAILKVYRNNVHITGADVDGGARSEEMSNFKLRARGLVASAGQTHTSLRLELHLGGGMGT